MGATSLGGVMTLHILPKESARIKVGEELYLHKAEVTYIVSVINNLFFFFFNIDFVLQNIK